MNIRAIRKKVIGLLLLLLTAAMVVGCGVVVRSIDQGARSFARSQLFTQGRKGNLSEKEMQWAIIAWKYFENNYNPATGLVNSADKYPVASMWHVADTIAGTIAAHEFELIDDKALDERFSTLLHFLNTMPLFQKRLPNRFYETTAGKMTDYQRQANQIGWSAIDIGRLLLWLKIASQRYPEFSEYIDKAILRWNFCDILDNCGALYSGNLVGKKVSLIQEGRLGYEEYAAMGFQAWGFDTEQANSLDPYESIKILDVEIWFDARDPRETGTYAPVISGPYLYSGIELNWDLPADRRTFDSYHSNKELADLANRIYQVQENRFEQLRILTARTDHQVGVPPHFVYDSIYAAGYPWNTISDSGQHFPRLATVSTRAAFGMWALWKTPYTQELMVNIEKLYDAKKGWYEGRYEISGGHVKTLTLSTNTMILEALLYKSSGKLFRPLGEKTHIEVLLQDIFSRPNACFPPAKEVCPIDETKKEDLLEVAADAK